MRIFQAELTELPPVIGERARLVGASESQPSGEFVLYWLQHAMRARENPALDAAVTISNRLGLPLLVYQALPKKYPFGRLWQDVEPETTPTLPDLPFEPLDFSGSDCSDLVGECEIDHTIAPVAHTPGGSTAGYARWDVFRRNGLAKYARLRNNPLVDGTSRLSPYLHYGMVSPLRIAREAGDAGTQGAEKFLDELLIWRELAYAFCFYRRDHENLAAIPVWARETLADQESDDRPKIHAWETLARGRTGDELWDAAQHSF